jgi:peptide/nickel transport system permease protein
MTTYLIRRSLQGLLVLIFTSAIIYALLNLSPGGPMADVLQKPYRSVAERTVAINAAIKRYGLDKDVATRYLFWLYNWDPIDSSNPEYLTNTLNADKQELPNANGSRQQQLQSDIATLPAQIAKASKDLAACQNIFDFSNIGTCLSVPRNGGILTGNWGLSWKIATGSPVLDLIFGRGAYTDPSTGQYHESERWRSPLANTIVLMGLSVLLSLLIAFPIGVYSAVKQYSVADYAVTLFSFFGISMPTFWFGLILYLLLGLQFKEWHDAGATWLPYLPTGGVVDDVSNAAQYSDIGIRVKHLVMPVIVLSLASVAGWSRFLRASMLEVLRQDYVRTAWAKGLRQRTVILKHALRNALIPQVTLIALAIPALFGGAIITERIFNYGGMGTLYFHSVASNDWPVMMAILIITSFLVVVCNMLADIAYALVDPRIRYS